MVLCSLQMDVTCFVCAGVGGQALSLGHVLPYARPASVSFLSDPLLQSRATTMAPTHSCATTMALTQSEVRQPWHPRKAVMVCWWVLPVQRRISLCLSAVTRPHGIYAACGNFAKFHSRLRSELKISKPTCLILAQVGVGSTSETPSKPKPPRCHPPLSLHHHPVWVPEPCVRR